MSLSKTETPVKPEPVKPAAQVTDAAEVKAYLQAAGVKATEINKLPWGKPVDIIESVVKLHGGDMASYRAGGLG